MQSRRHEHYSIPSDPLMKSRDRRIELGADPYAMPRRDMLERRSPRSRRSLSPQQEEGFRRLLGVDRRSNSVERRDYGWDGGARGQRVRSRSPPFGLVQKRSHYDEGASRRDLPTSEFQPRYGFIDYVHMEADKPADRNEHSAARQMREKNYDGYGLSGTSGPGMPVQKMVVPEEDASRDLFRLPRDLRYPSKYGEGGGSFLSTSENLDFGRFKDDRARYPDPLVADKERETVFYSREVSYPQVPVSQSKDRIGASQFKDFAGTSSGISRANFQGSYQDGMPLPTDEYVRNSPKLSEPLGFSGYGQRSILESGRDPNMEGKDLAHYRQDTFSPSRAEHHDYFVRRSGGRGGDDYRYSSDEVYERIGAHERVEYDHEDLIRPGMRDPITERADNTEHNHGHLRDISLIDYPLQKQMVSSYLGARISTASKGSGYLDSGSSHFEFGRRGSRDRETLHMDLSRDDEISHLRSDYGFGRDAGPVFHRERMRFSPELRYEEEIPRHAVRTREIQSDELGSYDSSDRALKRKYSAHAEMSRRDSRNITSGKWHNGRRIRDLKDRSEERSDDQDSIVPLSSRNGNKLYQRTERMPADRHRVSASENWLSSHDSREYAQERTSKPYKPGDRYSKGHLRPDHLSSDNSYHLNGRVVLPKRNNVWVRGNDNNQVDVQENDVDQSENGASSAKSDPPGDSDEFKQLVHKAFLMFSKKLNENPVLQRRYKERGRAGSLFCVVCGRSQSKEFMDAQRLGTHAFMSHKPGLRTQHLGLHKAICVLLGWNCVVAPDVTTWTPEVLPDAEAMAQKEDLILWPPVIIIHNSAIEKNSVDERKVISLEALGDFLRGKGFSGGKIKSCFGKQGNQSVFVVKFMGTFSGLQDAERLRNYFIENNRGRADFEQVASSSRKAKSSSNRVREVQGNNVEAAVLYGYMGIAEDLDKVDTDTYRKCLIKSKKEVRDLENAPVKPQ